MLTDDARNWLKSLHLELYPALDKRKSGEKLRDQLFPEARTAPVPKEPRKMLTHEEVDRIVALVDARAVIVTLFGHGYICGIGASLHEHPNYPGLPPERLLSFRDDHLPPPTRFDRVAGNVPPEKPRRQGCLEDHVWEFFNGLASRPDNLRWIKEHGLEPIRPRSSYEY